MGRAIEHENKIDELNIKINFLSKQVSFLQETVEQMIIKEIHKNNI